MKITCTPVAFHRWRAEFWVDGEIVSTSIGPRPGCVVRDVMNDVCLRLDWMPQETIQIEFVEWS